MQQDSLESAHAAIRRAAQKRERDAEFAQANAAELCTARARIAELEARAQAHAAQCTALESELRSTRAAVRRSLHCAPDRQDQATISSTPAPVDSWIVSTALPPSVNEPANPSADKGKLADAAAAAAAAGARAAAAEAALARKDFELRELDAQLRRVTADARLALDRCRAPPADTGALARTVALSRLLDEERARRVAAEAALATARSAAERAAECTAELRAFVRSRTGQLLGRVGVPSATPLYRRRSSAVDCDGGRQMSGGTLECHGDPHDPRDRHCRAADSISVGYSRLCSYQSLS